MPRRPLPPAAAPPRPGPKPGPRPGPRPTPGPRPSAPHVETHARPASDPSAFGRVDDDGTVWLVEDGTPRVIGSWQAGTPAEGLAHYGRRFDDLATEIELLEERLSAGTGDPRKTKASATTLRDTLADAAVIGDVAALRTRLTAVIDGADGVAVERTRARESARAAAVARKEELCAEAETIGAESTQWKHAGD
ncbi:MAG: DUF349 domain-containing protein, partial [Gordonia paraffinivorans]